MRIFQGMIDIASQASFTTAGLRARGHQVTLATFTPNIFSAVEPDITLYPDTLPPRPLRWMRSLMFAHKQMLKHDVFHFHFATSMLPYGLDLPLLRLRGKKVFMEFHGSDIRQGQLWTEGNPQARLYPGYQADEGLKRRVERTCRSVDGVIVHDSELAMYLPDWAPISYMPLRVDVQGFSPSYPDEENRRPLIVHIPSNAPIKGSKYIREVIDALAQTYEFDYLAAENIPNDEVRKHLSNADIVIDQIILGVYGVLALEAMSLGKPVIDFLRDDARSSYPDELPVINASKDNLYDVLRYLLEHPHYRADVGRAGRLYAERYHDCQIIAMLLEKLYTDGGTDYNDALAAFRAAAAIERA